MATKLTAHTFVTQGGSKYDWDSWLDGSIWLLERGVDYKVSDTAIRATVYQAGAKRGLRVAANATSEGLVIQASPR